jgi:hypothetical protein
MRVAFRDATRNKCINEKIADPSCPPCWYIDISLHVMVKISWIMLVTNSPLTVVMKLHRLSLAYWFLAYVCNCVCVRMWCEIALWDFRFVRLRNRCGWYACSISVAILLHRLVRCNDACVCMYTWYIPCDWQEFGLSHRHTFCLFWLNVIYILLSVHDVRNLAW